MSLTSILVGMYTKNMNTKEQLKTERLNRSSRLCVIAEEMGSQYDTTLHDRYYNIAESHFKDVDTEGLLKMDIKEAAQEVLQTTED